MQCKPRATLTLNGIPVRGETDDNGSNTSHHRSKGNEKGEQADGIEEATESLGNGIHLPIGSKGEVDCQRVPGHGPSQS